MRYKAEGENRRREAEKRRAERGTLGMMPDDDSQPPYEKTSAFAPIILARLQRISRFTDGNQMHNAQSQ
jgi:hypothetical protein